MRKHESSTLSVRTILLRSKPFSFELRRERCFAMRNFIFVLILAAAMMTALPFFCETGYGSGDKTVVCAEGKILEVDTFRSIVTVRIPVYYPAITRKDVALFVKPGAKIMKGRSELSIFDLVDGTPVSVKYIDELEPPSTLLSLAVTK